MYEQTYIYIYDCIKKIVCAMSIFKQTPNAANTHAQIRTYMHTYLTCMTYVRNKQTYTYTYHHSCALNNI